MEHSCRDKDCGVVFGLTCADGFVDATKCPKYLKEPSSKAPHSSDNAQAEDVRLLPWSGRALGLTDLMLASAHSTPIVVGLVGPHNAGKTAFLTALFAHFSETGRIAEHAFAGSYTLQAWERQKKSTQWPHVSGPSFPPHTPDTADRIPGLLNLALRRGEELVKEILFTDAPGEWFARWVADQTCDSAEGARWIARHATHFLFFVDREALAGPDVGIIRQQTLQLARVLSEQQRDRPVIVIWAKSDLSSSPEAEVLVRQRLEIFFKGHRSFETHVQDPQCLNVFELILTDSSPWKVSSQNIPKISPFLAYPNSSE